MHVPVAFSSKCEHDLRSWFSFWEGGRVKHGTSQLSSDPSLAHHPVEAGDHGDANAYPWLQVRDKWHGTPRQRESFGKTTWHGLQQGPDWNANTTLNPNRACWWTCQTDTEEQKRSYKHARQYRDICWTNCRVFDVQNPEFCVVVMATLPTSHTSAFQP